MRETKVMKADRSTKLIRRKSEIDARVKQLSDLGDQSQNELTQMTTEFAKRMRYRILNMKTRNGGVTVEEQAELELLILEIGEA